MSESKRLLGAPSHQWPADSQRTLAGHGRGFAASHDVCGDECAANRVGVQRYRNGESDLDLRELDGVIEFDAE